MSGNRAEHSRGCSGARNPGLTPSRQLLGEAVTTDHGGRLVHRRQGGRAAASDLRCSERISQASRLSTQPRRNGVAEGNAHGPALRQEQGTGPAGATGTGDETASSSSHCLPPGCERPSAGPRRARCGRDAVVRAAIERAPDFRGGASVQPGMRARTFESTTRVGSLRAPALSAGPVRVRAATSAGAEGATRSCCPAGADLRAPALVDGASQCVGQQRDARELEVALPGQSLAQPGWPGREGQGAEVAVVYVGFNGEEDVVSPG